MITHNWRELLQTTGAKFTEDQAVYFQTPEQDAQVSKEHNVLADLSHLSLLAVTGADAAKFLQGQLTCDVDEISEHQTRLGAHCNPKGRILTSFRLLQLAGNYYLQLPSSMLSIALKRLGKYAIFSKVKLTDASEQIHQLGLSGPNIADFLSPYVSSLPTEIDSAVSTEELLIIRLAGIMPRYQVIGPYDALSQLWSTLSEQLQPVGANAWKLLDIMAGIPSIYPETCEVFTPHHINYQLINGISFKKGCYTGQEIVARMQYLGKLKQHMYQAVICSTHPVTAGETVMMVDEGNLKAVGEVVMAIKIPAGYQLLITMQDKGLDYPLQINQNSLQLLDLPYSLPIS